MFNNVVFRALVGSAFALGTITAPSVMPLMADGLAGAIKQPRRGDGKPATLPAGKDYGAQLLAFNRETMSGVYAKAGKHGAWDAKAVAFLDRMAEYFTSGPLESLSLYGKTQAAMLPELHVAGKALMSERCDDPLVHYCYGVVLHDMGKTAEAVPHVRAAFEGLGAAGYPNRRVWAAAKRLAVLDPLAEVEQFITQTELQMACGQFTDFQRRMAFNDIGDAIARRSPRAKQRYLMSLAERPDADPWLSHAVHGVAHMRLAWDSRGGGWADTVTDDGWRGFHENLKKARDHLVAAHKLAPHLPEAATEMITVAMGAGDELGEDARAWFDRAEGAQPDFLPAYNNLFLALLPRWGGTHAAMYELGLHAMKTGSYDTVVPWQLIKALDLIRKDTGQDWQTTLARPEVYEAVSTVADGYAAALAKRGENDAWHRSLHAAAAWRAQKFVDARRLLDELGDRTDPSAFAFLESQDPPAAIGHAYAMSGPHASDTEAAEAALKAKRYDDALAAYRTIQAKPDLPPRMAPYLKARIALIERRMRFERGEPEKK